VRGFTFIRSWEEATEIGRVFRLAGDEARFDLGDLALADAQAALATGCAALEAELRQAEPVEVQLATSPA